MDTDILQDIDELAEYNWTDKLDDHKKEIVEKHNSQIKRELMGVDKQRMFSNLFASGYGLGAISLSTLMIYFFIAGSVPWGLGVATAFAFYSLSFGGLCKFSKAKFQNFVYSTHAKEFLNISEYDLTPQDLIGFYDSQVTDTLREKTDKLKTYREDIATNISECEEAIRQCTEISDSTIDKSVIYDLEARKNELKVAEEELGSYRTVMRKLEVSFENKVEDLKGIMNREKELEKKYEEYENLSNKVSHLLGKSKVSLVKWEEEKEKLQTEIAEMVGGFQQQLSYAGQTVKESLLIDCSVEVEVEAELERSAGA